jgi:hypothetical protein
MRSFRTRLSAATAVAMLFVWLHVTFDFTVQPQSGMTTQVGRLLSTAMAAWAEDDDEIEIEIDEIEKVKRGEERVRFRADVKKSGLVCKLKIKYADGEADSPDDVESDKKGICELTFDVPNRKAAVGDATAKLKVETTKGADRGKASRNFQVRDRRGG